MKMEPHSLLPSVMVMESQFVALMVMVLPLVI
jgi:hypothetical protein